MNRKQISCLLAGIATIMAMGLFPPWVIQSREMNRLSSSNYEFKYTNEPGPYSWIWAPPPTRIYYPASELNAPKRSRTRFVDLYRLGLQYFMVSVVTAGLIVIFGDKKKGKIPK